MKIDAQIERLDENLRRFHRYVESLDDVGFSSSIGKWTPRDIVAHLVGWNRYVVEGANQIRRGELPFYDVDPGENYSKVNAVLIAEYPGTNRNDLLTELRASASELRDFLGSLDPSEWDRDYGVRHRGRVVTIRNTVDELIDDYRHHGEQIEAWNEARANE